LSSSIRSLAFCKAFAEIKRRCCEGLAAKNNASRYVGGRTAVCRAAKVRHEGGFVVGLDVCEGRPVGAPARGVTRASAGVRWPRRTGVTRAAVATHGATSDHVVRG
jgi:hypothetical protein